MQPVIEHHSQHIVIPNALIEALIIVESHGDDLAYGLDGEVGCLQISQKVLDDVNRFYPIHWTWHDCLIRERSKKICRVYLEHYATEKRIGRKPTLEDMARIWNAGPKGWKYEITKEYAQNVLRVMQQLNFGGSPSTQSETSNAKNGETDATVAVNNSCEGLRLSQEQFQN